MSVGMSLNISSFPLNVCYPHASTIQIMQNTCQDSLLRTNSNEKKEICIEKKVKLRKMFLFEELVFHREPQKGF